MHTRVIQDKEGIIPNLNSDDRVFLGEGLFETLKVESAHPCFAQLHWERLNHSAASVGIPFELSYEDWLEHLILQIRKDNLFHGGIKAILMGGSAPRGLTERGQVSQLLLQTFNYTLQTQAVRLCSANWLRDCSNPIYKLKSINYLEAILASRKAVACGADDALFFNTNHFVTETSSANVFIIKHDVVYTPPIDDGVLGGITRGRLLAACEINQIPHEERSINKSMLEEADAVFITNSLQGIRTVASLDQISYDLNHPLVARLISVLSV